MMTEISQEEMSKLAYGTWKIENGAPTTEAVLDAIEVGYRHIDTAAGYGNDFAVGKAIKKCQIPRDELFITNKLWNTCRGYEEAIEACKRTLKLMKLDYLDEYLIHWPVATHIPDWQQKNLEAWRGLEALLDDGLVKHIGVSNFLPHHLEIIFQHGKYRPEINQMEMHPGKSQNELIRFCLEQGIVPVAWSPLGHGAVLNHPVIKDVAQRYKKTEAQICLRFCLDKKASVITRSVSSERMKENMDIFDFHIRDEDISMLEQLEGVGDSGLHPDDLELEIRMEKINDR